jgi:hypothetical protein
MAWRLSGFEARLSDLEDTGELIIEQVIGVLAWLIGLFDDPFTAAAPDPNFGRPFWFARVPDTTSEGHVVVCSYVVDHDRGEVRCSSFALLRLPLE